MAVYYRGARRLITGFAVGPNTKRRLSTSRNKIKIFLTSRQQIKNKKKHNSVLFQYEKKLLYRKKKNREPKGNIRERTFNRSRWQIPCHRFSSSSFIVALVKWRLRVETMIKKCVLPGGQPQSPLSAATWRMVRIWELLGCFLRSSWSKRASSWRSSQLGKSSSCDWSWYTCRWRATFCNQVIVHTATLSTDSTRANTQYRCQRLLLFGGSLVTFTGAAGFSCSLSVISSFSGYICRVVAHFLYF